MKFEGNWDAAEARLDRVVAEARRIGSAALEHRARIELLMPRLAAGELSPEDALDLLGAALTDFEVSGDELGLGRAWHLVAAVQGAWRLRYADAGEAGARARGHYRGIGVLDAASLPLAAAVLYKGPTPVTEGTVACRGLLEEAETPVWQSFILPFLAVLEAMQGRFDEAREHLAGARSSRREFADGGTIATSWSALAGEVELLAEDAESAERILRASCDALRPSRDRGWLATNLSYLADALYRQDRFDEAFEASAEARAIAPRGHLTSLVVADRVNAKCLAQRGSFPDALSLAGDTLE